MTVGAIDEVQAARAGNVVRVEGAERVLVDGRTGAELARIPADAVAALARTADQRRIGSDGSVVGDCGESHIYLRDVAQNDIYQFETGFRVNGSAWDFGWFINIRAETADRVYNFLWDDKGPKFPGASWTSGWKNDDTPLNAVHVGRVLTGSSAFLTDGRICFSGNPTDAVNVS